MRPILALCLLATLGACATPREICVSDVTRNDRVLARLVEQTRANVARGFALEERRDVRRVAATCYRRVEKDLVKPYPCFREDVRVRRVPVGIDLEAERAKLVSQERRLAEGRATVARAVAQCRAQYPA